MIDVLPLLLAGVAAGAPLLASVCTFCFGRKLPSSRMQWPAMVGATASMAAGVAADSLLSEDKMLPADPVVVYRWMSLPGDEGVLEFCWQFDAVSIVFLIAIGMATLVMVWYRANLTLPEDVPRRLRFLSTTSFLQSLAVVLLLARDWLTFCCCWQLMTVAMSRLYGESSEATDINKQNWDRRAVWRRLADATMFVGLMLYWREFSTFEFSAVTTAIGQDGGDSGPAILWPGLCLFAAAAARCSLFPLPLIWSIDRDIKSGSRELIVSYLFLPIGVYLIARSLPLLQRSEVVLTTAMSIGATTALFAALCSATQTDAWQRLRCAAASLFGFSVLGLGTLAPIGKIAALLLTCTQIVALPALVLTAVANRIRSTMPLRWIYLICAAILASGLWGQHAILSEVAQRFRTTPEPLQEQILLVLYWMAVASLPCFSFALARGYFELRSQSESRSAGENQRRDAVLWNLPLTAIAFLLLVIDSPDWLSVAGSRALDADMRLNVTSPLTIDVGLPLVLLGAVIAWLRRATFESRPQDSQEPENRFVSWIRCGYGLQRFWELVVGLPLLFFAKACRLMDAGILGAGGRMIVRHLQNKLTRIANVLTTGHVQFYLLSVLLATALLLLIFTEWGK